MWRGTILPSVWNTTSLIIHKLKINRKKSRINFPDAYLLRHVNHYVTNEGLRAVAYWKILQGTVRLKVFFPPRNMLVEA